MRRIITAVPVASESFRVLKTTNFVSSARSKPSGWCWRRGIGWLGVGDFLLEEPRREHVAGSAKKSRTSRYDWNTRH